MPELRRMYPDMPPAIQLPPEQQRRFLFNAYRDYIENAAKFTPIIHVFEDLHWAYEPTLLLLLHIAQVVSTTPILVICTYRDVDQGVNRPFERTLETLLRPKLATRISLKRLSIGGVESILAAAPDQSPAQAAAMPAVVRQGKRSNWPLSSNNLPFSEGERTTSWTKNRLPSVPPNNTPNSRRRHSS